MKIMPEDNSGRNYGFEVRVDNIEELANLAVSGIDKWLVIGKTTMPQSPTPDYFVDEIEVSLNPFSDGDGFGNRGYMLEANIIPPSGRTLEKLVVAPDKAFSGLEFYGRKEGASFYLRSASMGSAYPIYVSFQDIRNWTGIRVWHDVHTVSWLKSLQGDILDYGKALEQVVNAVYNSADKQAPPVTLQLAKSDIIATRPNPKAVQADPRLIEVRAMVSGLFSGAG